MAHQRITIDSYELHTNYGYGWEHECTEFSWYGIKARMKEYRENVPGIRLKKVNRRIRIDSLEPGQHAGIIRQIASDRRYWLEERKKRKANLFVS